MNSIEKISIIVPVYNAELYLPQCIDSLLNQTLKNIEIICVNDGSSDNSIDLLNEYALKDNRIRVIDKENNGVSQARNDALRIATGEYIMFVDADDWVDFNTCEKALMIIKKHNADVIMWSYVSENAGNQSFKTIFEFEQVFDKNQVENILHRRFVGISGKELMRPELADSLCPVWGKLYRRSLIEEHNIKFIDLSEIGTYEDGLFNLEVFNYVDKAVYYNECLYHYRRDNESSVTSKYRDNLYNQWQNLFSIMNKYITGNQLPQSYRDALDNRIALSILGLGLNILDADVSSLQKINMLKKIISENHYRAAYQKLEFKYFPIHWKVFYTCAKYRFSLGLFLLLRVIKRIIG